MNSRDARTLLASAIAGQDGRWVDLGAGDGVFTRALVELLGPGSHVYALDRDAGALETLARQPWAMAAGVTTVVADFDAAFELPGLDAGGLAGILVANALHFVRDQSAVVGRLATRLRPGGRLVIVEYDRRAASQWVPYPIPIARLSALTAGTRLSAPVITASTPSVFGGDLYVAVTQAER